MSQESRIISAIKAARGALEWSQPVLAKKAGISLVALARLEAGNVSPRLSTISKIKAAIEDAGIRIADDYPQGGYTVTVNEAAVSESENKLAASEPPPRSQPVILIVQDGLQEMVGGNIEQPKARVKR